MYSQRIYHLSLLKQAFQFYNNCYCLEFLGRNTVDLPLKKNEIWNWKTNLFFNFNSMTLTSGFLLSWFCLVNLDFQWVSYDILFALTGYQANGTVKVVPLLNCIPEPYGSRSIFLGTRKWSRTKTSTHSFCKLKIIETRWVLMIFISYSAI